MSDAPLAHLGGRWIFVVGKGGVGKTTTAGALGLAFADAGESTHLISTDPAHSLADLFGVAPAPAPIASPCTDTLTIEELDAAAYAERWRSDLAGPLAEVIERGTYLDAEDASTFLNLSLPGIDEVMAALRLAELDESGRGRIVVDTAPTGHTLRLLDAGRSLAGWITAFDAMEEKAEVVASTFARRAVRLAAADVLAKLESAVSRFEGRVLRESEVVLVGRADAAVVAETERLEAALRRRGLRVALRVAVGPGWTADEEWYVASRPDGDAPCDALRRWRLTQVDAHGPRPSSRDAAGTTVRPGATRTTGVSTSAGESPLDLLAKHDLLLFAGKGGVGKSTCAAAAGVALAGRGLVSLFSTDPAGSLGDLFGVDVLEDGVEPVPGLRVQQVDAAGALRAFEARYRERIDATFERLGIGAAELDRKVVQSLWELAPPGVDEIFAVATLIAAREGEPARRLVVDSAPTGHFLRLLEMPEVALAWIHALMRVTLKYAAGEDLERLGEALLGTARRVKALAAALRAPDAGAVVVELEHSLVRAETVRLTSALNAAGIPVAAQLWNRSARPSVGGGSADAVPVILAPEVNPPPRGPERLHAFFRSWRLQP